MAFVLMYLLGGCKTTEVIILKKDEQQNFGDIDATGYKNSSNQTNIELGNEIGWSENEIIQKITNKLKISQEKAKSLFDLLMQGFY